MSRRTLLLAGLGLAVFASQEIWITFSPVTSLVSQELGVGKGMVGLLAITYPALFLLLTLPSGMLLDRSFRTWLTLGVLLTGLGGALRLAAPRSYWWLLSCQLLAAVGQPFLLNSFAPLAGRLFPERREQAVSALSFAMYLGIIFGLGTGYAIYTRHGLVALIAPGALAGAIGALLYLAALPAVPREARTGSGALEGLKQVASSREIWLLGAILGLGVALFDNMSIWLETALSARGLGSIAGTAVALSLLLGLGGVAVIPTPVARAGRRTLYIKIASLAAVLVYTALALSPIRLEVLTLIPLLGLLMLPAYPIIMEWISTFLPREIHGSASGFIGLVSRAFTVALAAAAVRFTTGPAIYFSFLAALATGALALSLLLPRDK